MYQMVNLVHLGQIHTRTSVKNHLNCSIYFYKTTYYLDWCLYWNGIYHYTVKFIFIFAWIADESFQTKTWYAIETICSIVYDIICTNASAFQNSCKYWIQWMKVNTLFLSKNFLNKKIPRSYRSVIHCSISLLNS